MTLTINGETREFPEDDQLTVTQVVAKLDLGPQPVLVELDGLALYPRDFDSTKVAEGAVLEIIRMVAGG